PAHHAFCARPGRGFCVGLGSHGLHACEVRRTPGIRGKRHMDVPRPRVRTWMYARAVTRIPGVRRPPPEPAHASALASALVLVSAPAPGRWLWAPPAPRAAFAVNSGRKHPGSGLQWVDPAPMA